MSYPMTNVSPKFSEPPSFVQSVADPNGRPWHDLMKEPLLRPQDIWRMDQPYSYDAATTEKLHRFWDSIPEHKLARKSLLLAMVAHNGQRRRDQFHTPDQRHLGEDYINHPLRMAIRVRDIVRTRADEICDPAWCMDEFMSIALLHDTIEDGHVTAQSLVAQGYPPIVVEGVLALTRREGQSYFHYIMQIPYKFHCIKLLDLQDNLEDLEEGSLKDKYRFAEHYLIGCKG